MVVTEVTFRAEDGRIAHFPEQTALGDFGFGKHPDREMGSPGTLRGSRYYLWGML